MPSDHIPNESRVKSEKFEHIQILTYTTVTWRIFITLLSRFGERISTMKSPLLAAGGESFTSAFRVTRILVLGRITIVVTSMLCTSNKINDLKGRYRQLKRDTRRRPTITHYNVDLDNLPPLPPPLPNVLPQLSNFPPDVRHNAT